MDPYGREQEFRDLLPCLFQSQNSASVRRVGGVARAPDTVILLLENRFLSGTEHRCYRWSHHRPVSATIGD
jgi:hypothetical protein